MKTEQEVRDAITKSIYRLEPVKYHGFAISKEVITKKEVQDLAVIIGKALGLIEENKVGKICQTCEYYYYFSRTDEEPCSSCENFSNWKEKV